VKRAAEHGSMAVRSVCVARMLLHARRVHAQEVSSAWHMHAAACKVVRDLGGQDTQRARASPDGCVGGNGGGEANGCASAHEL